MHVMRVYTHKFRGRGRRRGSWRIEEGMVALGAGVQGRQQLHSVSQPQLGYAELSIPRPNIIT